MTKYISLPLIFPTDDNSGTGSLMDVNLIGHLDSEAVAQVGATVLSASNVDGVFLIDASPAQKDELEKLTGIKLFENRIYDLPDIFSLDLAEALVAEVPAGQVNEFAFVVNDPTGGPVAAVSFRCQIGRNLGPEEFTDANGHVVIRAAHASIPVLHIRPRHGYWPLRLFGRAPSQKAEQITLTPIDLKAQERYADLLGTPGKDDGKNVKIAIIDTGITNHRDIRNVVKRIAIVDAVAVEDTFADGLDHGTHVAGVIAGANPDAMGQAPAAELYSYRVCAPGSRNMSTLDVVVAITEAVTAGVDIVNLSLGFDQEDGAISDAISFARSFGVLVVAASGNSGRARASFPARMADVVSVSALGKVNAYPHGTDAASVNSKETQGEHFVAGFCDVGHEQIQCSAPGVGIVSTVQYDGYQAISGTSMASPVVCALAATLLSKNLDTLGGRSSQRLQALLTLLYTSCKPYGFHADNVGHGVPFVR